MMISFIAAVWIWLEPQNYLVVLKITYDHFLLKTTCCPESRRRMQLQKDYNAGKDGPRLFCWLASLIFVASNDYFIAAMEFARPAVAGQNAL